MAKINTPKSFDKAQIPAAAIKDLEPFVDYVNQNFDQLIRALDKQLTFSDNLRGSIKTLAVKHLEPLQLAVGDQAVAGVIVLSSAYPIRSLSTVQGQGTVTLTFRFDDAIPVSSRNITADPSVTGTFIVETKDPIKLGDIIRLSGYGQGTGNNGDFLVEYVYTDSPMRVAYRNPIGQASTLAAYTNVQQSTRSVTVALLT